jgi:uncharacterized membrane protein
MKTSPKKWPYFIFIIIVVFIIVATLGYYYVINNSTSDEDSSVNGPEKGQGKSGNQNYTLLVASAVTIVLVVLISYYFTSKKVDKHLKENIKLISQIVNTNSDNDQSEMKNVEKSCKTVILKFLNYNENKVLKKLIENNGSVLQSEISRSPNMGKVKTHRVLKDMEIKGIISIEKYGKTNRINLSEDVGNLFLKQMQMKEQLGNKASGIIND